MRLLYLRLDDDRRGPAEGEAQAYRRGDPRRAFKGLKCRCGTPPGHHSARSSARGGDDGLREGEAMNAHSSPLQFGRRDFLRAMGALVVTVSAPAPVLAAAAVDMAKASVQKSMDPAEVDAWLAVAPDGMVTAFFGKAGRRPGRRGGHRPDRGRGDGPAGRARGRAPGRHRHDLRSGRSVGLDGRAARRSDPPQYRRRGAPAAGRARGGRTEGAGRSAQGRERGGVGARRRQTDLRPAGQGRLQRQARLERAVRQWPDRQGQGQAQGAP